MIKIAVVVILVAIIAISAVGIVDNNRSINYGGYNSFSSSPFLTLTANITHPSPQANFTYGYVNPNLWNLQQGDGNATMIMYSNSSVLTTSTLSNVSIGYGGVIGYPSEHFTKIVGESVQSIIDSNLSSFASFRIVNHTSGILTDVAYDIFLSQGGRLTDEIMIYLYKANYDLGMFPYATFNTVVGVNGISKNISWSVEESTSSPWGGQLYAFVPNINFTNSMSYKVNFSPFFKYLLKTQDIETGLSIARFGIGSEFSYNIILKNNHLENLAYYSFWLYSYFIINGTKYQIIQPSGGV